MDEVQERAEIDRLIAEQLRDDRDYQAPEFPNVVPLDSIEHQLGTQGDQIVFVGGSERGSVLVAGASWHGTLAGYARQRCRCRPCKDAKAAYERKRRTAKS